MREHLAAGPPISATIAALEADLRDALGRGLIHVHYQPVFDCLRGELTGFEALARWRHPERGAIAPAEFIPLAEATGLIVPLGLLVLESACAEAMRWAGAYKIAVNLSPAQFRAEDLPAAIAAVLARTGLPPDRLELEITEGVLIEDTARTDDLLRNLKALGIRLALDDFGAGYSSLGSLRRYPFSKLKMDRLFMAGLGEEDVAAEFVRAVLGFGRALRLDVTAEGVETPAQLRVLRAERCGQVQGFLLGRPVPAEMLPVEFSVFRRRPRPLDRARMRELMAG